MDLTPEDMEIARKAVEDTLIDFRDKRISLLMAANGLVVNERNGKRSSVIRLTIADALRIGLRSLPLRAGEEKK